MYNVATLIETQNTQLRDFGIFIELEPDEEDKVQLEQNIQVALQTAIYRLRRRNRYKTDKQLKVS